MNELKRLAQQATVAVIIAIVAVVGVAPSLFHSAVSATASQVTVRSIKLGSSTPSASTTYALTFTPATTTTSTGALVVDFCSNDPLYNDTCSFSASTVPTVGSVSATTGTAAAITGGTPTHAFKITGVTLTSGTPFTTTVSNITNPTTAVSFYARITTYANSTDAGAYAPASTTGGTPTMSNVVDYGGDALSTATNITITAKVFETLSFCVYNTSCGGAPTLTLGDPTTGALSTSSAYATNETGTNSAQYTISTNAGGGVGVVMRGTTLCRSATPLTDCENGQANYSPDTITAIGGTAATLLTANEQFGMCADTTGATGSLLAQAPYADSAHSCHGQTTTSNVYTGSSLFGFLDTTGANGTNSAGGSLVLQSAGAVSTYTGSFMFLADAAATTEAGVYTTSLNMVATSTF